MNYRKVILAGLAFFYMLTACAATSGAAGQNPARQRILFVLTSHSELYGTGKKTGFWFDALATPYYLFKDAGYEVTLASVDGLKPPADPRSEQEPTAAVKRFLADKDAMQQLSETTPLMDVKADGYVAVFLPGGHGMMWDCTDNVYLKILLVSFAKDHKIIGAVDHGAIAFLGVTGPDGKLLIEGRKMAAFTREEERALGLVSIVPVFVDYSLEKEGAVMVRAAPFKASAVQDGNVITGQNPASVAKVAKLMLAALKK